MRRRLVKPPSRSLRKLVAAALRDITIARLTIGLFDMIMGIDSGALFPGYRCTCGDLAWLPSHLRSHGRALISWACKPNVVLNEIVFAHAKIIPSIVRARRNSPYGRRRIRIVDGLRKQFPPLRPEKQSQSRNLETIEVLSLEIGRPLSDGTIRRLQALQPAQIEIRRHKDGMYAPWAERTASIQLQADGFSIEAIALTVQMSERLSPRIIHGVLEDFSETGTEGLVWSVLEDGERDYAGIHTIEEGDHLTICDGLGNRVWAGKIDCDREIGWRRYPLNPVLGQPCALGYWIHWTQHGFKPDDWARFFVRPRADRMRGILRKRKPQASGADPSS